MNGRPEALPKATREAAADWVVRLQALEVAEADWLAFESWLLATPGGRGAFDAAMSIWLLADTVDHNAIGRSIASTRPRGMGMAVWGLAGLSSAAVVAALLVVAPQKPIPGVRSMPSTAVYTTAKGEQRAIRLADGTRIDLGSASRVVVAAAPGARRVTLTSGEAAFTVTHDPRRPFAVTVGDREVRDLGTEFDVRRGGSQIAVTVREGQVEVADIGNTPGSPVALGPGQRLQHEEGSAAQSIDQVSADEVFAWKQGRLIYRDQPLSVVVDDLNRYFPHAVRIEGGRVAALRFTGVLAVDGEDATIRRLVALLPISANREGGAMVLRARDETH